MNDNNPALPCSALAQGLPNRVSAGLDAAEAKRLWLAGFAGLVDIRTGKKREERFFSGPRSFRWPGWWWIR